MTTQQPWLGHRDLCPIQWGEACDCEGAPISADELQTKLVHAYAGGRWSDDTACLLVAAIATAATVGSDDTAKARALDAMRRCYEAVKPK